MPVSPVISSRLSVTGSDMQNSEKSLSETKVGLTEPKVAIRKKLLTSPVECSLMGNLPMVKMIQFIEPVMNDMVLIKVTQAEMGIIKHSVTLFQGIWESRKELLEL